MGTLHVAAACTAIAIGMAVLARRRKGDRRHRALGYIYTAAMLIVNFSVLGRYDASGRPGPFHALAVISIVTTALGWLSLRRQGPRSRAVEAHASFMTWSLIGVVTAGLAQGATSSWPAQSPWPVMMVIGVSVAAGLVFVPRLVSHQLRRG